MSMTREEFEQALQTVYEVELGDAGDQWFALLAHDAEQREEIARLRRWNNPDGVPLADILAAAAWVRSLPTEPV